MTITDENINAITINKSFTIELDNGDEINIYKFGIDDPMLCELENGWEYETPKDRETAEALPDTELDALHEFIGNIKLF